MITAEKILEMRKVLGITQDYLARVFEISPKTVYRWESNKAVPRGTIEKKLKALEVLLENKQMLEECRKVVGRRNGMETLRYLMSQIVPKIAEINDGTVCSDEMIATFYPAIKGQEGLSIKTAKGLSGTSAMFAAYKMLHKIFKDVDPAELVDEDISCMICGKYKDGRMYRCMGDTGNERCGFMVCETCIYKSRGTHRKKFPQCNKTAVPNLEKIDS